VNSISRLFFKISCPYLKSAIFLVPSSEKGYMKTTGWILREMIIIEFIIAHRPFGVDDDSSNSNLDIQSFTQPF
jgi:hypothetical protein